MLNFRLNRSPFIYWMLLLLFDLHDWFACNQCLLLLLFIYIWIRIWIGNRIFTVYIGIVVVWYRVASAIVFLRKFFCLFFFLFQFFLCHFCFFKEILRVISYDLSRILILFRGINFVGPLWIFSTIFYILLVLYGTTNQPAYFICHNSKYLGVCE